MGSSTRGKSMNSPHCSLTILYLCTWWISLLSPFGITAHKYNSIEMSTGIAFTSNAGLSILVHMLPPKHTHTMDTKDQLYPSFTEEKANWIRFCNKQIWICGLGAGSLVEMDAMQSELGQLVRRKQAGWWSALVLARKIIVRDDQTNFKVISQHN